MSDDSEDFGPLQANTPNKPRAVPSQSKPGSSRAAGEAGPSRVTNNKARKKTATAEEPSDDDEVQEIAPRNSKNHPQGGARGKRKLHKAEEVDEQEEGGRIEDDEDVNDIEEIEQPRTKKARAAPKKPPSTAESTAFTAKGKGKQKARTGVASKVQKAPRLEAEPMDLDAIEIADDDDAVEEVEVTNEQVHFGHVPKATSNSRSMAQNNSQLQDSLRKNDRLEKELRQARKHIEDLRRQVEEAHQVRQTEPEQLMERMEVQHKAELTARDDLNRQYAEQLAQKEPLFSSSAGFELFTREQVNRETLHLEQQIKDRDHVIRQHEQNLKKKDEKLKMKDQEIEELKEDKRLMKLELDAEIERVKQLSSKSSHDRGQTSTQSRTRAGNVIGSSSDPKYSKIISFYEDLTNIIVPYMKSHPGKYHVEDTDDWVLRCLYVHKDVVNKQATNGKSLSFDLRLVYDLKPGEQEPVTSQSQLVQSVQYTPLNLDMEPPEFRDSLGFLGDNFTFERDQLSLFVRTLYDYMSGEANEKGEGDEDDSVQFVE